MSDEYRIFSIDHKLSLCASKIENDIALTLNMNDRIQNSMMFSELCSVSTKKPWKFKKQKFQSVFLDGNTETIRIAGKSNLLKSTLNISFANKLLMIKAKWEYTAPESGRDISVALIQNLHHDLSTEKITMPHILYNDNPSADPDCLVPHFGKNRDACLVCEESRFPIPAVNVEWLQDSSPVSYTMFSIPDNKDNTWSLGCDRKESGIQVICASGVLAFNGEKDMTYGKQKKAMPLEGGYHFLEAGNILQKEIIIALASNKQYGHGFREISIKGFEIFQPKNSPKLHLDKVIELKTNALNNRYHSDDKSSGYICVLPDSIYPQPPYYLFGWTGQSLLLAWCSAILGLKQGNQELIKQCQSVVDFYINNSLCDPSGLRYNRYLVNENSWRGEAGDSISSRAFGEAVTNLGKILETFNTSGLNVPSEWTEGLLNSADFLSKQSSLTKDAIFPIKWSIEGSPESNFISAAGISCVTALLKAYRVSGSARHLDEAKVILERYWKICGDKFDRPFSRATLDAKCEDKEAGLYFFLAAYELFLITNDSLHKEWAEVSADWILTYVYHWHTGFRQGTICAKNRFVTTGWPGVSVQNHHLDVFFPAYELFDLGCQTNNSRYKKMGRLIFDAWSHGICRYPGDWEHEIPGEQGEQFFQTNYFQGPFDENYWRGGYNRWNPSWIIALVLEAGLKFKYC